MKSPNSILFAMLAFIFVGMFSASALAWWVQQARVDVQPTMVTATITNTRQREIFCRGSVYGRTSIGTVLYNSGETTILPGRSVQIHVTTIRQNHFIDGWAEINCR